MLKMPMAIMLAPLVPVQYSVPCSFFPADAKNVNHNEISQKNSITFDTFSFLLSTSNLIGNPNFLLSGLSSCTGAWVYNKSHYNANCKIGRAVKKIEQSWDFVPNRGWVGKWPFAIQKKFYNIYHLTKLVLDLPNTITSSEKRAHTNYMFANCWPISPFSRISWHRPTMGCSAAAPCCSFSKTGTEENW